MAEHEDWKDGIEATPEEERHAAEQNRVNGERFEAIVDELFGVPDPTGSMQRNIDHRQYGKDRG